MASQRIQKKKLAWQQRQIERTSGQVTALYAIRKVVVAVPCSACQNAHVERSYLPALGGVNGSVTCLRCRHQASYVETLAAVMADDPVTGRLPSPPPALSSKERNEPGPSPGLRPMVADLSAWAASVFRQTFGIRRRWRFASA